MLSNTFKSNITYPFVLYYPSFPPQITQKTRQITSNHSIKPSNQTTDTDQSTNRTIQRVSGCRIKRKRRECQRQCNPLPPKGGTFIPLGRPLVGRWRDYLSRDLSRIFQYQYIYHYLIPSVVRVSRNKSCIYQLCIDID